MAETFRYRSIEILKKNRVTEASMSPYFHPGITDVTKHQQRTRYAFWEWLPGYPSTIIPKPGPSHNFTETLPESPSLWTRRRTGDLGRCLEENREKKHICTCVNADFFST